MKNIIITGIMAVSFSLVGCSKQSSTVEKPTTPASVQPGIDFSGVDPSQALFVYSQISGLELVIDSPVKSVHTPIVLHNSNISTCEMATSLERALTEQAGIVIKRLDDKKASVTYDSTLRTNKSR